VDSPYDTMKAGELVLFFYLFKFSSVALEGVADVLVPFPSLFRIVNSAVDGRVVAVSAPCTR